MSRLILPALSLLLIVSFAPTQQPSKPPDVPGIYNSGTEKGKSPPLSAEEVVAKMKLPPGFKATVFAAEPDVRNPIAMAWDGTGRIYVAENYTYAEMAVRFDLKLRDRILIFEDKGGKFAARKVFYDQLQRLMSVEVGLGGVWAMCPPQLLFIPDRDGDGVPDGPPEVVLDGFTVAKQGSYHTIANGLRFGPDGWLYGRCGGSNPGEIGPPGTPAEQRTLLRGTMWRYHTTRKVVEVLSHGTTNPWGHDWNEHGEFFFINTTNGHLWHQIPGAHYTRGTTKDPNPRAYDLIDMHADHYHWDKSLGFRKARGETADALGGGHAHVGMTIYQGDNWPAEYRGRLLTINMFGHRINQEILERSGSGYVGKRGEDIVFMPDPWFRGMEVSYGPDGGLFMLDWSDTGDYHDHTGVHRESGRIYKITYGDAKPSSIGDVARLSDAQLVALLKHENDWFTRQARLELGKRFGGRAPEAVLEQLRHGFSVERDVSQKLRFLWTLYALGAADDALLRSLLRHPDEHLRVWAIRLLTDTWPIDTVMSKRPAPAVAGSEAVPPSALMEEFTRMAGADKSGLVRLALASTLQRLPATQRAPLAEKLLGHAEDATDHNLPLLIWYGLIPVAEAEPLALANLAAQAKIPLTRRYMARRLVEELDKNLAAVNQLLIATKAGPEDLQADILSGMSQGLKGARKSAKPAAWDALAKELANSKNAVVREKLRDLSVIFGDARALDETRRIAADPKASLDARRAALEAVIDARPPELRRLCEDLLPIRELAPVAARGLATFDDPAVAKLLVDALARLEPSDRPQVVGTLAARPSFAMALLDGIAEKKLTRADVSAYDARQIRDFNEPKLNKKLTDVWGELRDSPAEKKQLIAKWKNHLSVDVLGKADKSQGRLLFNKTCATCHTLYGEGAKVGPDLTGGGRQNLDFLLGKIGDPGAMVSADYRMMVLSLKDGRVVNGVITAKNDSALTLRTVTDSVTVAASDIESSRQSNLSLMPDGMLETLTPEQVRDLIAYLMHTKQVPLPAGAK